jgi:hypothetical protein
MKKRPRNRHRVIYQNQFLYTSWDAVNSHFNNGIEYDTDNQQRNIHWSEVNGNLVRQLHRIQSVDYGFKRNTTFLNQFGSLGRFGSVDISSPDVFLDFEYLLADGYNEQALGFITDGNTNALSKQIMHDMSFGQNFFLAIGPDGSDIINANLLDREHLIDIIGIGNAFLKQYSITGEVGSVPKARLSYDGFNVRSYKHKVSNLPLPSINPSKKTYCPPYRFSLPDTYQSFAYPKVQKFNEIDFRNSSRVIMPAGISLYLDDGALISRQYKNDFDFSHGAGHIQGFTINVPLPNIKIHRLGSHFQFNRAHVFPATLEGRFRAIVSELKESNLSKLISCGEKPLDLVITMQDCSSVDFMGSNYQELEQQNSQISFYIRGAKLQSEGFTSVADATSSKMVEFSFTAPIASIDDCGSGFFMFGRSFFADRPKILAWGHPL